MHVCVCMGSTVAAVPLEMTVSPGDAAVSPSPPGNDTAPKASRAIGVMTLTSMKFTLLIYAVALLAALSVI